MRGLSLRKINNILILIIATFLLLYVGESFLKPLAVAFFFATLMVPVSNFIEKSGIGRTLSAFISTLVVFLVISGLLLLVVSQAAQFASDLPEFAEQIEKKIPEAQKKIKEITGVSKDEQLDLFQERLEGLSDHVEGVVQNFLQNIFTTLSHFMLSLVYLFLILIHRSKFVAVALSYVPAYSKAKGKRAVTKSADVAYHYLWGRIKVMAILGVLYYIALLSFGIEYALLFTVLGAILTIIPYIGPLMGGLIPVIYTLFSGEEMSVVFWFAAVILIIQLIESYLLEPWIIGNQVNLTPLFIIIAIVLGGMVWGILGMILFVPFLAVLKIFFDEIEELKPMGYLFGNSTQTRR